MDLALNNLQRLICHETQQTKPTFYVDNLIGTGNDMREMKDLYKNCYERMLEGGFILRSWNSNLDKLRKLMKAEG